MTTFTYILSHPSVAQLNLRLMLNPNLLSSLEIEQLTFLLHPV